MDGIQCILSSLSYRWVEYIYIWEEAFVSKWFISFFLSLVFVSGYTNGFIDHFKVIVSRCLDLLSSQRLNEYVIEKVLKNECRAFWNIWVQWHVFLSTIILASVIMSVFVQFIHSIIVINCLCVTIMMFLPFPGSSLAISNAEVGLFICNTAARYSAEKKSIETCLTKCCPVFSVYNNFKTKQQLFTYPCCILMHNIRDTKHWFVFTLLRFYFCRENIITSPCLCIVLCSRAGPGEPQV